MKSLTCASSLSGSHVAQVALELILQTRMTWNPWSPYAPPHLVHNVLGIELTGDFKLAGKALYPTEWPQLSVSFSAAWVVIVWGAVLRQSKVMW